LLLNPPGKSKNRNQGLYYLYFEAVSVRNSKSQTVSEDLALKAYENRDEMLPDFPAFSPRDLEFIVKFSEEHGSDVFRQMLQSFCPSIYGHELVKGILNRCEQFC
jgi:DNA helicase MCM8